MYSLPVPCSYNGGTAGRLHELMTSVLGYQKYAAHGGDVGSGITERLALDYPESPVGIHFTEIPFTRLLVPPADQSDAEQMYFKNFQQWRLGEAGYVSMHGTKPLTLAQGLNDSPAGLAAWIIEKFRAWSDCNGVIESRFSKDELLTNLTIYWATETIGTSFLPCFSLRIARLSNSLLIVGLDPKLSTRRFLIVVQRSLSPWRRAPLMIF